MAFKNTLMFLLLLGSLKSFCAFRNSEGGVDLVLVLLKSGKYFDVLIANEETASRLNNSLKLPKNVQEGDLVLDFETAGKRPRDRAFLNKPHFALPYSVAVNLSKHTPLRIEAKKQHDSDPSFFNLTSSFMPVEMFVRIAYAYKQSDELKKQQISGQLTFEENQFMQEIIKTSGIDDDIQRGFSYFAQK